MGNCSSMHAATSAETLESLYNRHALVGLDLHLRWTNQLQKRDLTDRWDIDLPAGKITFIRDALAPPTSFDMEVLGSASGVNDTWLWIWANRNIHPKSTAIAGQLKALGERHGIKELSDPQSGLDRLHFYTVAMIASGITGKPFHIVPTEQGGCTVMIITEEKFDGHHLPPVNEAKPLPMQIISVFQQGLSGMPKPFSHHRNALVGLCESKGLHFVWAAEKGRPFRSDVKHMSTMNGGILQFRNNVGPVFEATFDTMNRLTNFSATVSA